MNIRHFASRSEAPPRTVVTKDGGMPRCSANVGKLWEIKRIDAAFTREVLWVVCLDNLNTKLPLLQIISALTEDKGSKTKPRETNAESFSQ